ncbi:hypothetical protein JG687_00011871 [Phytophthora cactorum]|uniref:Uncharacterized protein n=1 Tax=Phytophthora cactorum TaxID=29920 RepID=A0A8T1U5T5_9STRA|nr:hypothetical protein JG687_00011871 [Phytophthora cactorum]
MGLRGKWCHSLFFPARTRSLYRFLHSITEPAALEITGSPAATCQAHNPITISQIVSNFAI